jgi:hypothetical protein
LRVVELLDFVDGFRAKGDSSAGCGQYRKSATPREGLQELQAVSRTRRRIASGLVDAARWFGL